MNYKIKCCNILSFRNVNTTVQVISVKYVKMATHWSPTRMVRTPAYPVPVPFRSPQIGKLIFSQYRLLCVGEQWAMPKIISPASFAVYCDKGGAIPRCKCQDGYAGHLCERSVITWEDTFNQCCKLLTEGRVLWCTRICVSIQPLPACILFSEIEQVNRWSQKYNKFSSKFVIVSDLLGQCTHNYCVHQYTLIL